MRAPGADVCDAGLLLFPGLGFISRRPAWIHRLERGSPGDGATCDACGEIITANQVMMELGIYTGDKKSWCFHADCFMLWNTERGQL